MVDALSQTAPIPGADCLSDDDAAAFVSGDVDGGVRDRVARHLDACDPCRRFVSKLAAAEIATPATVLDVTAGPTGLRADGQLGRFRLIRPLGAGSMGEVWAARDPELDREVALKLLRVRPEAINRDATARMRREAQAMARLNHPNVVTIHELGTDDHGRVFCAMELVDGTTLRSWIAQRRPWRSVINMAGAIGRAIAAAHAAGLIHRDIKPENVLIDRAGHPLVSDFGLAKLVDLSEAELVSDELAGESMLAVSLTRTGAVIGTPHYMAPEQLSGRPADARSDQFAYCVTIYETLFGARPFRGASIEELRLAIVHGPMIPAKLGGVPRGVLRCLVRGLTLDPAARWPSMSALVHELERAARRPRRRLAALAVAVTSLGAGLAATALLGSRDDGCLAGVQLIDDLWNPTVRDAQVARFTALDSTAGVAIRSATRLVDDWTAGWQLGRRAVCTVNGPERTARRDCLERDLQDLRAQLAIWRTADRVILDAAVQAAAALPDLHDCVAPPPDRELNPALAAQITQTDALVHSGRAALALELVAPMLAAATRAGNPRGHAIALVSAGRAERDAGKLELARAHLAHAAQEAGRAADDHTLLDALVDEAAVLVDLGKPQVALGLLDAAQALDSRGGARARQRITVARGDALQQAGRIDEAITTLRELLPSVETEATRDAGARLELASLLSKLATALRRIERYPEAFELTTRALAIYEASLGPSHPDVARTLRDLATAEQHLERYADAKHHLARAIDIAVHGVAQNDALLGSLYVVSAQIALYESRLDDARADYERARAATATVLPPDHVRFAFIESGLGELDRAQDHCKDAIPHFERSIHIMDVNGHDPRAHALRLIDLGYCLGDTGRTDEARNVLLRSISEILDLHIDKRWLSDPYANLAELEYAAGNHTAAIELERKALAALVDDHTKGAEVLRAYEREMLEAWTKKHPEAAKRAKP